MKFDEFEPWRIRMAQAFDAKPDIEITKFSESVGKNKDYIGRLIRKGTANPSPTLLITICEKLGVSPAYIISGEQSTSIKDEVARKILEADEVTLKRVSRAIDLFDDAEEPK